MLRSGDNVLYIYNVLRESLGEKNLNLVCLGLIVYNALIEYPNTNCYTLY